MHLSRPLALCAGLALAACADKPDPKPEAAAAAPPAAAQSPEPAQPAQAAPAAREEEAAARCGQVAASFAYDSVEPLLPTSGHLAELARCLSGSLEGAEPVVLVGRADARGSEAYNDALGLRRADRVRSLLVQQGLPSARIRVRSLGEQGAMGHLPGHTHAEDRRVDVLRPDDRVTLR